MPYLVSPLELVHHVKRIYFHLGKNQDTYIYLQTQVVSHQLKTETTPFSTWFSKMHNLWGFFDRYRVFTFYTNNTCQHCLYTLY